MSDEPKLKPPYVSYGTFKNFLGSLKELIPARIDPTHPFMVGQSGSSQSYLMSALRFFALVEDRTPTPALKSLAQSEGDDRKAIWKSMFCKAYEPIMGDLDLTTATAGMIEEKFRAQDLTGETVKKCFYFYIAAAEDAGLPMASHLKPGSRGAGGGPRKPRKARAANGTPAIKVQEDAGATSEGGHTGAGKGTSATMLLDEDGTRKIVLHGPPHITPAELKRLKSWVTFQFIVKADEK